VTARQMTMPMACVWCIVFEAAAIAILCSGLLMLIVICTACLKGISVEMYLLPLQALVHPAQWWFFVGSTWQFSLKCIADNLARIKCCNVPSVSKLRCVCYLPDCVNPQQSQQQQCHGRVAGPCFESGRPLRKWHLANAFNHGMKISQC